MSNGANLLLGPCSLQVGRAVVSAVRTEWRGGQQQVLRQLAKERNLEEVEDTQKTAHVWRRCSFDTSQVLHTYDYICIYEYVFISQRRSASVAWSIMQGRCGLDRANRLTPKVWTHGTGAPPSICRLPSKRLERAREHSQYALNARKGWKPPR